jgi:hypothetical protein
VHFRELHSLSASFLAANFDMQCKHTGRVPRLYGELTTQPARVLVSCRPSEHVHLDEPVTAITIRSLTQIKT